MFRMKRAKKGMSYLVKRVIGHWYVYVNVLISSTMLNGKKDI